MDSMKSDFGKLALSASGTVEREDNDRTSTTSLSNTSKLSLLDDVVDPGSRDVTSSSDLGSRSTAVMRSDMLNPLAKEFQSDTKLSRSPPPSQAVNGRFFELRKTPHKGFGLFASKFVPAGTRIICESPLLTIPDNYLHLVWGPYCGLSIAKKAAFDNLHGYVPEHLKLEQASRAHLTDPSDRYMDEEDVGNAVVEHVRVMSIFACNNFKLDRGLGVFEIASRLNHSCVPNVHHCFNPSLQKQTVHAIRNIEKGEELCTTYIGGSGDYYVRAQRIDTLERCYGFTCNCISCADVSGTSDGRRELMGHIAWGLQQYLERSSNNTTFVPDSSTAALMQVKDLITLLIGEGLASIELMKAYHTASSQALAAGEFHTALEYAYKERDVQSCCLGAEVDDLRKSNADANVWIDQVRATTKAAGVPAQNVNEIATESKASPQSSSKTKNNKKDRKRRAREKKRAEDAARRLAVRAEARAAKNMDLETGHDVADSKAKASDTPAEVADARDAM